MSRYTEIATEIGKLVEAKNAAYGDSFSTSPIAMHLLYPDGIPVEKYGTALVLVRMWDKMQRIATNRDALGEDPFIDIAGYALLAVHNREKAKTREKDQCVSASTQVAQSSSKDATTSAHRNAVTTKKKKHSKSSART